MAVGTDVHPFDRLVTWADRLAADLDREVEMFVQHGHSRPARRSRCTPFLGYQRLRDEMEAASVVVTHGGPGTIMGARDAGHLPIVVPRDPRFGEHVDDHQKRFAALLASERRIGLADDYETLEQLVTDALTSGRPAPVTVEGEPDVAPGVLEAGRVLDELLAEPRAAGLFTRTMRRLLL